MKFRFVVAWFISTHLFIAMFWKLGDSQLVPQGTYYLFLWAILVTTPLLICLFFILFWIKTEHSLTWTQSFQTLGYKKPDKKQLLVCAILVLFIFIGHFILIEVNIHMGVPVALDPDWIFLLFQLIITAGIFEETFYRGFLFRFLRPGRTFLSAAILSGLLWSLGHLLDLAAGANKHILSSMTGSMIAAILLMVPIAYIFERGKNVIWGGILVHLAIDFFCLLNIGRRSPTYYFGLLNIIQSGTVLFSAIAAFPLVNWLIPEKRKNKNLVQLIEAMLNPFKNKNVNFSRRWFWLGSFIGFVFAFFLLIGFGLFLDTKYTLNRFKEAKEPELVGIAGNYFLDKQYEKSRVAYEIVLEKNPNNYDANYFLGSLYSNYLWPRNYSKAAFHIQTAFNLRQSKENLYYYGWVLFMAGQLQESEKIFQQYLDQQLGAKDPNAWEDLGIVLLKESKKNAAQKAFETALLKDPHFSGLDRIKNEIKNISFEPNLEIDKPNIEFPEQ